MRMESRKEVFLKSKCCCQTTKNCDYNYDYSDSTVYMNGSLTVTRLDLTQGIIAGTFEFTLAKPGCDTIRVTSGRFDKKL